MKGLGDTGRPTKCPVCEFGAPRPSRQFGRRGHAVLECTECGVAYFWPLPRVEDVATQYEWGHYARTTYEGAERSRQRRIRHLGTLLEEVETITKGPGTMVDIGCSSGNFLEAAQRRGWRATGIELDPETARRTAIRCNVPVHAGSGVVQLERLGSFDLIVMSHWLEHVPDPADALRIARRHLAPGGLVLLRVPNARSQLARATGPTWYWFIPGVHLFYFGPRSIEAIARVSGLKIERLSSGRGDANALPFELAIAAFRGIFPSSPPPFSGFHEPPPRWRGALSQMLRPWMEQLEDRASTNPLHPGPDGPELVALLRAGDEGIGSVPARGDG